MQRLYEVRKFSSVSKCAHQPVSYIKFLAWAKPHPCSSVYFKLTSKTLLEWGLLDEVVPKNRLMERALELAEQYAAQPPMAAQMVKRSVNVISSALDEAVMHMDPDQLLLATSSEDYSEGIKAFLETRRPDFTGR